MSCRSGRWRAVWDGERGGGVADEDFAAHDEFVVDGEDLDDRQADRAPGGARGESDVHAKQHGVPVDGVHALGLEGQLEELPDAPDQRDVGRNAAMCAVVGQRAGLDDLEIP
jgi:hypothetical protein